MKNFRYLLIRVAPDTIAYESRDLYRSIVEAVESMYGDLPAARIWPSVVFVSGQYSIIRCRRGLEESLEAALATITSIMNVPVAVHPVLTSGTIRTLQDKIPDERIVRKGRVIISKHSYDAVFHLNGGIDLKENGIYHEIARYITEEDTEDHYYDE